jgi:DNA-binding Xre family transcriptional regulator
MISAKRYNILNKTDIIITKELEQLSEFLQSQLRDVIDIIPEGDPESDRKEL